MFLNENYSFQTIAGKFKYVFTFIASVFLSGNRISISS
jgi:hypothetical protein